MNIAVLFDGAGLARQGLEQSGHHCTGFELDPIKHYLSKMVGSGNCILQDATTVDLTPFDAIWASPPCQFWSDQNHGTAGKKEFGNSNLLLWSLDLVQKYPNKIIWIENVISNKLSNWGIKYNAAQFLKTPIQKRRRMIGGNFKPPKVYRSFKYNYPEFDICPAVLASEYKQGGASRSPDKERRKATRWYGRSLTIREMAYHQGFNIPESLITSWFHTPNFLNNKRRPYTYRQWMIELCQAIGNGVPVYMAKAFGDCYPISYLEALQ